MTLKETLEVHGRWLFTHRGIVPLLIPIAALPVLYQHHYPLGRHGAQEAWVILCILISLLGQVIRFVTIGQVPPRTSGRNRRHQVADVLNTDGVYSVVRNPLYLGNCLTWLGLACVPGSFLFAATVGLIFWIFHERVVLAEEAFLEAKFGDQFRKWAALTPAFLPRLRLWRRSTLHFSFRAALGREYVNLFAVATGFTLLDGCLDSIAERHLHLDAAWGWFWAFALVAFVGVRFLRKCTCMLTVEGR